MDCGNPYAPNPVPPIAQDEGEDHAALRSPQGADSGRRWVGATLLTLLVGSLASFAGGIAFFAVAIRSGRGGDFAPMLALGYLLIGCLIGAIVGGVASVFALRRRTPSHPSPRLTRTS